MKKLICFACFIALSLTSCSTGGDSSPATESDVLVKKSVETYALDGSVVTTNYTYNGKRLVKETDSDGYYEKFTYTGDLITKVEYFSDSDELEETETFTYNSSDQLIMYVRSEIFDDLGFKETYVYNSNGTVTSTGYSGDATTQDNEVSTGTIHLSSGEVSFIELDFGGDTTTHTYTYDTKNTPYMNITGFDKIAFVDSEAIGLHHNIVTDTSNDFSGNTVTTTTYTYNSLNFPLTDSEIEGTDATSVISTVYTYN